MASAISASTTSVTIANTGVCRRSDTFANCAGATPSRPQASIAREE